MPGDNGLSSVQQVVVLMLAELVSRQFPADRSAIPGQAAPATDAPATDAELSSYIRANA